MRRRLALLVVAAVGAIGAVLAASPRATSDPAGGDPTTATVVAIRVTPAGQAGASAGAASGPPSTSAPGGGFAYPADGSIARAGSIAGTVTTVTGLDATSTASADVAALSLFNGEITADAVAARATAAGDPTAASVSFDGASIDNLVVLGQPISPAPGLGVPLADWGSLSLLAEDAPPFDGSPPRVHGTLTVLSVHLTADHGGLPAGSDVVVGYAAVAAQAVPPPPPPSTTTAATTSVPATTTAPATTAATTVATTVAVPRTMTPTTTARPATTTRAATTRAATTAPAPATTTAPATTEPATTVEEETGPTTTVGLPKLPKTPVYTPLPTEPQPSRKRPKAPVQLPPADVSPQLTAGGYVFPVYGDSGYGDTFGAARADVAWHHGDDIFAPLGSPILAVADGTVFSVGWNDVGGNRLWLRDGDGNEFYYAHLSAFSPLAVDGARVKAGAVVGFVGNTGDAELTPPHLHFEIHPVSLLFLGYDGVVNPTPFLDAWRHLDDLRFSSVAGWAPSSPARASAPKPGAILLQSEDISTADGLEPGSLQRALQTPLGEGRGGVPQPLGRTAATASSDGDGGG